MDFDQFFHLHDYKPGEEPQAMADFLSQIKGSPVIGVDMDSAKTVRGRYPVSEEELFQETETDPITASEDI